MGASRSGDIADAYATWLNDPARGWTLPSGVASLGATRTWAPDVKLTDLAGLLVEVVPAGFGDVKLVNRGQKLQEYVTILAVRQHYAGGVTPVPNEWVDARVGLLWQIADKTFDAQLAGQPSGYQVQVKPKDQNGVHVDEECDGPSLQQLRSYVGILIVTWWEIRPR